MHTLIFVANLMWSLRIALSVLQTNFAIDYITCDMNTWRQYCIGTRCLSTMQRAMCGQATLWKHSVRCSQSDSRSKGVIAHISSSGSLVFGTSGDCWEMPRATESHQTILTPLTKQEIPSGPVTATSRSAALCE